MSIIVTGAGGFVGRALVCSLLADRHDVTGVDIRPEGIPAGARIVTGDIGSAELRAEALANGCTALVHLATVPGGAAEADPAESRRINIDAMYDLLEGAAITGNRPRIVYASSIAVLGDALPATGVDDATPLSPRMVYGGHKAMMEHAVAMLHNRGAIDGITVRLSGILARPKGPSGMKSAFMSDIFHALRAGEAFRCPIPARATIWAQSVPRCVANLRHALASDGSAMPPGRAVTLPALRFTMAALAAEIAGQCGVSADLVSYGEDPALEAAFGTYPPLATPAAEHAGFGHDGSLTNLVTSALGALD